MYFAGRNEKWVREAQEEIGAEGGVCRGYLCDLADAQQSEATAREVLRDSGGIDILVSTVGVNWPLAARMNIRDEDMFRLLETNYLSGLRFARQFAPGMCERGTGSIINISSIHSVLTQPGNMLYAGTKGAMNAAARAMALDYAPYGVRVNTICPGVIMSDVMFDAVDQMKTEEEKEAFWEGVPEVPASGTGADGGHLEHGAVPGVGYGRVHHGAVHPRGRRNEHQGTRFTV